MKNFKTLFDMGEKTVHSTQYTVHGTVRTVTVNSDSDRKKRYAEKGTGYTVHGTKYTVQGTGFQDIKHRYCISQFKIQNSKFKIIYSIFLTIIIVILSSTPLTAQKYAIRGETVHTAAGAPILDGVVLVNNGKIERVGHFSRLRVPTDYEVITAKVVTPGFIDARSVVGLAGYLNQPHEQDQLERSSPFQPELRAIDAYNARENLVVFLREKGVTTLHTGHGPGALASGQTMVVKTTGNTINEALVDSVTMVAFSLGRSVTGNFSSPGSRSKAVAMLRGEFLKAVEYNNKMKNEDETKRPGRDLKMEIMSKVLNREVKAMFYANQITEILTALRLQEEFGFDLVLEGAAEAYEVIDAIKKAKVTVIIHPTMVRTGGEFQNASFETASILHKNGIPFAFQSGFEGYVPKTRVVLYEAAIAVANGLPYDEGMKAITINPARLLGIDKRVGSLEQGKDADIALFDGDPFEYLTKTVAVMINGKWVYKQLQ